MSRVVCIIVADAMYHVTQRGNNQQDVFFVADDRNVYLELLHEQAQRFGFRIGGYCLMTNHVHVVGVPKEESSLAKTFGRTHFLYTQYVNRLHGRCGHLWQNRFFSCPMDEDHALQALCYVELNPVRAGMARKPWTYAWSSAAAHCGKGPAHPLLDLPAWRKDMPAETWRETVAERNAAAMDRIRLNTHTGRPLGSDAFLGRVEKLLGRRVRPLPVGRQRGWRKQSPEPPSARGSKG